MLTIQQSNLYMINKWNTLTETDSLYQWERVYSLHFQDNNIIYIFFLVRISWTGFPSWFSLISLLPFPPAPTPVMETFILSFTAPIKHFMHTLKLPNIFPSTRLGASYSVKTMPCHSVTVKTLCCLPLGKTQLFYSFSKLKWI